MIENNMIYYPDEQVSEPDMYIPSFMDSFEPQDVIWMIENNNNVKLSKKIKTLLETMEGGEDISLYYYFEQSYHSKKLIELLQKEHGFDGIVTKERDLLGDDLHDTVGAFNPEDIKGQFNPKPDKLSPKIMFQVKKLNKRQKPRSNEFKEWFGDSKVVDDKGKPMVVYHGTDKNFDQFKMP